MYAFSSSTASSHRSFDSVGRCWMSLKVSGVGEIAMKLAFGAVYSFASVV